MNPKSNALFHLTKDFNTLLTIIKTGFWPRYNLEQFDIFQNIEARIALPMVCFCEIPLTRISQHTSEYGRFGLGMTREWAIRNNLHSVQYVTENSPPLNALMGIHSLVPSNAHSAAAVLLRKAIGFTKPLKGLSKSGTEKNFYQEVEWRFIPDSSDAFRPALAPTEFSNKRILESHNSNIKDHLLEFTSNDIKYIILENDSTTEKTIEFITMSDLYTQEEKNKLLTKIISIEQIASDF
jgi:Putative abortive phage resistance protein AbiGi, antitoxin